MSARRCSKCSIDWPSDYLKLDYNGMIPVFRCAVCHKVTDAVDAEPISVSNANHLAFDSYWEQWDAARLAEQEQAISNLPTAA